MPYEIGIIRNYIIKNNGYSGTISNLLQLTKLTIAANRASRLLNTHKDLLASEGITFQLILAVRMEESILFKLNKGR